MTLRILLLLSLLGLLMGHRLPAARAQDESAWIDLPEGLHAHLISPAQLGLGWDESDALRLFVEFVPRDESGRFEAPMVLDARKLGATQPAAKALPTRPVPSEELEVESAWSELPRGAGSLQAELSHWSWFHMDGVLLFSVQLSSPRGGELRIHWDALDGGRGEVWDGQLPLHEAGPENGAWSVHIPRLQWDRPDGSRLYLGLVDVDARARLEEGQFRIEIGPEDSVRPWTLALVVAPSEASFRYRGAQALRLLPDADNKSTNIDMIEVPRPMPAICYLCRNAEASATELRIWSEGDSEIGMELWAEGLEGHGQLDGESAVLGGFPMARWWIGDQAPDRARYRLPKDNPTSLLLMEAAAATGHVEGEVRLDTGIELPAPRAELDPALRRERQTEIAEKVLPQHLSPDLLETWPNPFQDRTSIRVTVPTTIAEAFQFPDGAPEGVDLMAAPPFGEAPPLQVKVYNVSGKLVRVLEERSSAQGILQVDWDGTNLSGRPVAAGAYYISVEMGDYKVTRRVLRLRS